MCGKYKKTGSILIPFLIFCFIAANASYSSDKQADKIKIELISPVGPNLKLSAKRVDTAPLVVNGIVPVEINRTSSAKDIQRQRYLVEYFIDGDLAYKTYGADVYGYGMGYGSPNFSWLLDTTKYKNGKHKLVVNFWDTEGPSAIGITYIIVDNPLSIEGIKEVTGGE